MRKNSILNLALVGSMFLLLGACNSDSSSGTKAAPASKSNAGGNQLINLNKNAEIKLDGSGSTTSTGGKLSYEWILSAKPQTSNASLTSTQTVTSSFYADANGVYSAQLTVIDENLNVSTSTTKIVVMPVVAFSGSDQSVKTGATVQLDGQYTLHPNLSIDNSLTFPTEGISFHWSLVSVPAGSTAVISDTSLINPTFIADISGEYLVKLIVNDSFIETTDEVKIVALDLKAVAGNEQFVDIDATVQLDGSGSWNLNGDLTYAWSIFSKPAGSNAALSDLNAVNPSFVADVDGKYGINLTVSDGVLEDSDELSVITMQHITFPIGNYKPIALIGEDQTVRTNETVQLDGSASICGYFVGVLPGGDVVPGIPSIPGCGIDPTSISFTWSLVSIPVGSSATISDVNAVSPTFAADLQGDYVVKLVLDDGTDVTSDEATMTAADLNAIAGYDQHVPIDIAVKLDGTNSWNLNGDVFYSWSLVSVPAGSSAAITGATTATPTFTPDVGGGYEIELVINDGSSNSDSASMFIHAFDYSLPANE